MLKRILRKVKRELFDRYDRHTFKTFVPYPNLLKHTGISKTQLLSLFNKNHHGQFSVILFNRKITAQQSRWFTHSLFEIFGEQVYKIAFNKQDPYIVDCGANFGLGVIYLKQLYPGASILAFEADAAIAGLCRHNVDVFGFKDVDVQNKAVWVNNNRLSFHPDGGLGGHIVDSQENLPSVEAFRLKNLLDARPVDFLKIDIEGAEHEVIMDCRESLGNVGALFIEYHSVPGKPQLLHDILMVVKNAGFTYHIKEAWSNMQYPLLEKGKGTYFDMQLNIFCYRNEEHTVISS